MFGAGAAYIEPLVYPRKVLATEFSAKLKPDDPNIFLLKYYIRNFDPNGIGMSVFSSSRVGAACPCSGEAFQFTDGSCDSENHKATAGARPYGRCQALRTRPRAGSGTRPAAPGAAKCCLYNEIKRNCASPKDMAEQRRSTFSIMYPKLCPRPCPPIAMYSRLLLLLLVIQAFCLVESLRLPPIFGIFGRQQPHEPKSR